MDGNKYNGNDNKPMKGSLYMMNRNYAMAVSGKKCETKEEINREIAKNLCEKNKKNN
jgi:hypothetical protein